MWTLKLLCIFLIANASPFREDGFVCLAAALPLQFPVKMQLTGGKKKNKNHWRELQLHTLTCCVKDFSSLGLSKPVKHSAVNTDCTVSLNPEHHQEDAHHCSRGGLQFGNH